MLEDGEDIEYRDGVAVLAKHPRVFFVNFRNATWTLPGMDEPGLYPIRPKRATWYLDKSRNPPR